MKLTFILIFICIYFQCSNVSSAINVCVDLNQWHDAVELATKFNQPTQISNLLAKYAQHLLDDNKTIQAIELYRKANYFLEAAKLLNDLAKSETEKRSSPLRIKKLYVLSALLVEEHMAGLRKNATGAGIRSSALIGLVDGDTGSGNKNQNQQQTMCNILTFLQFRRNKTG